MNAAPRTLRVVKVLMVVTDVGFIAYWAITIAHVLPESALFNDYRDERIVAWNWSFLPLDLLISATGLTALRLARQGREAWRPLMLVSLTLTSCSGLQAIGFWTIRGDFSPAWWIPNLFLLLYPLTGIAALWPTTPRHMPQEDRSRGSIPPVLPVLCNAVGVPRNPRRRDD
ncbi:YvaD family protein [Uniformispora flossi]|uniref:YvaD family protein n=1 Tax=Uniformispora flossi TaxID=3390723 RepID=UPI003C2C3A2C